MDPMQPIAPRIPSLSPVEPTRHRVDPEQQKREQKKREQKRREEAQQPAEPEDDDGLPHIDVSV